MVGRTYALLPSFAHSPNVSPNEGAAQMRVVCCRSMKAMMIEIWRRGAKQCQSSWPAIGDGT
eukprot:8559341-Karenia_brevis.AAC.1